MSSIDPNHRIKKRRPGRPVPRRSRCTISSTSFRYSSGSVGPDVIDIAKLYGQSGMFTYDPGFTSTAELRIQDHLYRRRRGRPALPRLSDRAIWPSTAISSKPATSCSTASCRPRRRKHDFDDRVIHHTMVHEQMSRFFQGFRRDAHPMAVMVGCGRRAVGVLSRLHRHHRSDPAHDRLDPHDRQDADAGGDGLQIFDRPAVHLSEERARLRRRTSCACASRCRARNTRPIRCWRAPWTASSSCTPTTSRTPRPRRCGSPARPAPIRSPASPPASPACGARRMAAPTRRR